MERVLIDLLGALLGITSAMVFFRTLLVMKNTAFDLVVGGIISILVFLSLVFIAMLIVKHLQKAIAYKGEYELAVVRLKAQIEHYEKLYKAQHEIRVARHDMTNNLTAIYGLLENGCIQEAIDQINHINSNLSKSASVTDTGIPALDAIVDAKIARAGKSKIRIISKIGIACDLGIDGFDLAVVVANALDNAIEGVLRSDYEVEKDICLDISYLSDFVSVFVENYATGPINDDFQTSSKTVRW